MVKIKQKKTMNLPQLIEWAAISDVKVRVFESNPNFDGVTYKLGFNKAGDLYFDEALSPTLLFTIEVEEEITEDTEFKELISLDVDDYYFSYEDVCVSDFDEDRVRAIYIPNNDLTMTLIWRDGKLVE